MAFAVRRASWRKTERLPTVARRRQRRWRMPPAKREPASREDLLEKSRPGEPRIVLGTVDVPELRELDAAHLGRGKAGTRLAQHRARSPIDIREQSFDAAREPDEHVASVLGRRDDGAFALQGVARGAQVRGAQGGAIGSDDDERAARVERAIESMPHARAQVRALLRHQTHAKALRAAHEEFM